MNIDDSIFEEQKLWFYSEQKQTEIVVSVCNDEEGKNISIYDKHGIVEPALQDIPRLIELLKRLWQSELNKSKV